MAFARYLMRLSLGIWIGGLVFFPFLAHHAFSTLASRQNAGLIVGKCLQTLHWIGIACAIIFLSSSIIAGRTAVRSSVLSSRNLIVVLMLALTLISQFGVIPRMDAIRAAIPGEMEFVPRDNPNRVQFDKFHAWSTRIEGGVLLLGLGALYLTA